MQLVATAVPAQAYRQSLQTGHDAARVYELCLFDACALLSPLLLASKGLVAPKCRNYLHARVNRRFCIFVGVSGYGGNTRDYGGNTRDYGGNTRPTSRRSQGVGLCCVISFLSIRAVISITEQSKSGHRCIAGANQDAVGYVVAGTDSAKARLPMCKCLPFPAHALFSGWVESLLRAQLHNFQQRL